MTATEQIDRRHQEDLQRLKGFRLMDDDLMYWRNGFDSLNKVRRESLSCVKSWKI